ncbi:MAG: alpha/beta fold hydrolase [Candidatus Limnocylindrales bacterium]
MLDVPLDRDDSHSRSVSLPVRRLPASDPEQRLGVLIAIAGGPGQRGTDWVTPEAHPPSITSRFDIVGFDPRGTSGETSITCIPQWDPYGDLDRTPDDAAERDALDERIRELAAGCRETHGALLPHVGTADTVLDIEELRQALGETQISLIGWSYGSEVALRYASTFPDHTRAVVLDGYSDPNLSPPAWELEQATAFERELDELLVECALRNGCPLEGADPGATLDDLLVTLDETPLAAGHGRTLRQADAYEAITGALLRGPSERDRLLHAIAAAARGDGRPLLSMADHVRAEFEASGLDLGTYMAIVCADDGAAWAELPTDDLEALAERIADAAPRLGAWLWSPPAADDLPPIGLCAMVPEASLSAAGPFDGAGAGPIIVLTASGDPATPFSAALRAAEDLDDASLLTIRADRHLVYPYAVAAPGSAAGRCVLATIEGHLFEGASPARIDCPRA